MSPTHIVTQTLKYEQREDEIATLARVIHLLGYKDIPEALNILMEWRNSLIDAQQPVLKQYDPREERAR
jgi:hypothetical protein